MSTDTQNVDALDRDVTMFVMDGVTVQIRGDRESLDRVMDRIHKNSDRLGNYVDLTPTQASIAESQVAGLVEAAYREGFRYGMVDSIADESGLGGIGEDAYWSDSKAREALSKFRGEA